MNTFTNDGSFMEQFLKRQRLSSENNRSGGDELNDQQQQQQGGFDQNAYYNNQQQQQGGYNDQYGGGGGFNNNMNQRHGGGDGQDQYGNMNNNNNFGGGFNQQQGGFNNNNNNYQLPPHLQNKPNGPMEPTKIVWAGNVHPDATEDEVRALFSQFGYIQAIKILPQKQCAFITFADINCAIQAQYNLNGTPIRGFSLKLGFGKVENAPQQNFNQFKSHQEDAPTKNLWLGNVSPNVTPDLLKQIFDAYGNVDTIRILNGRGCAFVNFFTPESAINARNGLNGTMVCGMPLKINFRKEQDEEAFKNRRDRDREERGGDRGGDRDGGFRGGDRGGDRNSMDNSFNTGGGGGGNDGGFNRGSQPPAAVDGGPRSLRPGYREQRENFAPLPAPPPQSPQEQEIIDKFAEYVARTGPRLESFTAEKQRNNPLFTFLKPRNPSNDYYKWKLWTIRNPDTHSANNQQQSPTNNNINQQQQPPQQDNMNNNNFQQQQQQQQQQPYPTNYLNEIQVKEFKDILEKLSPSKPSVTNCKNWIMAHTMNSLEIISIIVVNFQTLSLSFAQKLNILHVLNDCLHNTNRTSPEDWTSDEFARSIKDYLPFIIGSTGNGESPDNQEKVLKVLQIWESQKFYPKDFIDSLKSDATDDENN